MALGIVGSTYAFTRNAHKVGVQFAVGILVVEDGDSISACLDIWKLTDCVFVGDRGLGVGHSFIAVFWEAFRGRVEVTHNLALVAAQSADFYMDQVPWGRLRLGQGWHERQRVCVERLACDGKQHAADV